jgi:hypothetical protein
MTEGVVSVQSIDPQAIAELASVFGVHKATVRSAHGGRLTRVVGVQIYFEAPTDQMEAISSDITHKFGVVPPVVSRVEDFPQVNKWIANYEVRIYIGQDRSGALAEFCEVFAKHDVNVVTIRAATGPTVRRSGGPGSLHNYWGQATIGVHIPDAETASAVLGDLENIPYIDRVTVEPIVEKVLPWLARVADGCRSNRVGVEPIDRAGVEPIVEKVPPAPARVADSDRSF